MLKSYIIYGIGFSLTMVHFCVIARSRSDEAIPVREEKRDNREMARNDRQDVSGGRESRANYAIVDIASSRFL